MQNQVDDEATQIIKKPDYYGYESQVAWGKHLADVSGCNDSHTPKKMTERGPVLDSSLMSSGHPSLMPAPAID